MNPYHQHPWLRAVFLIGVGMLSTHELDAMTHAEWRVLPLTSWLAPDMGRLTFVVLHVPIFALVLGWLTSQVPGRMIKAQEPKATPRPRLGSKRSERHQRVEGLWPVCKRSRFWLQPKKGSEPPNSGWPCF